ncbi:MAG: MATE family efflux transporter [Elusimicrobiaceae bacterium]|nr:MATE family efflux transporter [Elusimicrobiaceae bacterium]
MAKKKHITDFTSGKVFKQLLVFATPLFLSNLLQIVYNIADMVIVGQSMGKVGLSAVSVGGDITHFLTFIAMGFSNAGQVLIAQYLGARKQNKLSRFVATMFAFLIVCSIIISVLCFYLRVPFLHLMNTPKEAFSQALAYSTISILGLIFIYGYNTASAILRGMGDSLRPFIFIAISASLNIFLDLILVLGLKKGAAGAALATIISQGVSFIFCLWYIYTHRKNYGLKISWLHFVKWDPKMLIQLIKLGVPMAIKNASIHLSKLCVNSWINSYGVAVSAFAGVANKINSTTNLISNAFNTAGASMVGQNIGAEKYERIKEIIIAIFKITCNVAIVFTIAMVLFPIEIYSIFTSDSEVINIGMGYIPIAILIFWGSAARSGMNAFINGSGNYAVNFATALLDGIILRIGLSFLFGLSFKMGYFGFWLGDALAGFTPFFIGIVFYASKTWKKNNIV